MRIFLLQHDPTPGDFEGNARALARMAMEATGGSKDALCLTPFYAVAGVPWEPLQRAGGFYSRCREGARLLASLLKDGPDMLISITGAPVPLHMLLSGGQMLALPLDGKNILTLPDGTSFYVPERCEDGLECNEPPVFDAGQPRAILIGNSLPFFPGSQLEYDTDCADLARRYAVPVLSVSQCGASDGVVYAGLSAIHSSTGELLARARAFEPDVLSADLEDGKISVCTGSPLPLPSRLDGMFRAAVLATRGYAKKCGIKGWLVGLSGGMDSALAACIAVEAAGADNVLGVLMPSPYSSGHSVSDAEALARNLGIRTRTVHIDAMMDAFGDSLAPAFEGIPAIPGDLTADNLQPRIRGAILMAFANRTGYAVLGTGNKSELAVGYCTLYGDTVAALEPLGDIYKTEVYELAGHYNKLRGREIIPQNVFAKAPSAELHPDQKDEDSLPPYPVLDAILRELLENGANPATLCLPGIEEEVVRAVARKLSVAEFKRHQGAPNVKLSTCTFGMEWNVPATARYF